MSNTETPPEYDKLIYENADKGYQLHLVLNEYKGIQYIHIRKYFLSYEGDWVPSKEGVSMVAGLENINAMLDALVELCSKAEGVEVITKYFGDKLKELSNE